MQISDDPNFDINFGDLEKDTVSFNEIGISIFPVIKSYFSAIQHQKTFSFSAAAYACSPLIPTSEEVIQNIEIFSNQDWNNDFKSGESIAELFEVVVLYRKSGYRRINLTDFLESAPTVPDEIFLLPKYPPGSTKDFQFTVKYFQDGIELDKYEFTTEKITIKS